MKSNIKGDESRKVSILSRLLTRTEDLALVIPTFIRRKSDTKPIPLPLFARTQEKMATSFSLPYKAKALNKTVQIMAYKTEIVVPGNHRQY